MARIVGVLFGIGLLFSCKPIERTLPIIGESEIIDGDTIYHSIPDFSFVNQYGETINQDSLQGKIYVSDFFFTKCPTICPKMTQQMLRIHDRFKGRPEFRLLSHSIDPKYDTTATLKKYADHLGLDHTRTWHFLSVPKDEIYPIARAYMTAVVEDSTESGGYTHSGHFVLIDQQRHIRSFCDGIKPEEVDKLMKDIDLLLNAKK